MIETPYTLRKAACVELSQRILPYWASSTLDEEGGGFYGRVDSGNVVRKDAAKGVVLNARLLWTFSESALFLMDKSYHRLADRAGLYLQEYFWDNLYGGAYWMLRADGTPLDTKKLTHAQAFLLYALTAWYRLTGENKILVWARELFDVIEQKMRDPVQDGYFEGYSASWQRLPEAKLSENDPLAAKSSNTLLHLLEAYTSLYRIWKTPILAERLEALLRLFLNKVIDMHGHYLHGAFDAEWHVLSNTVSFGHDIEASWLLVEAAETLGLEHSRIG